MRSHAHTNTCKHRVMVIQADLPHPTPGCDYTMTSNGTNTRSPPDTRAPMVVTGAPLPRGERRGSFPGL